MTDINDIRNVTELAEQYMSAAAKARSDTEVTYYEGTVRGLLQSLNYLLRGESEGDNYPARIRNLNELAQGYRNDSAQSWRKEPKAYYQGCYEGVLKTLNYLT